MHGGPSSVQEYKHDIRICTYITVLFVFNAKRKQHLWSKEQNKHADSSTDREYITLKVVSTGRHMEERNPSLYYVTMHASSNLYQRRFKHHYVSVHATRTERQREKLE